MLLLVAVAAVVRRKTRRRWVDVTASQVALAGWVVAAHFLLQPLIPASVLAVVILAGSTLAILLTAVIGGRAHSSGKPADGTRPSANARNVGAKASSAPSSTSNHVTDGSADFR